MSAHELIGEFANDYFDCGALPESAEQFGLDTVQALRAAGYAVVELPKPNSLDAWPVMFDGEVEDVYGKTNGEVVISGVDTMSSVEARSLALALLAAADAAEANA